jgi:hypothetical protein
VLVGVVEDQAATFLPRDDLVADPDAALLARLGDLECEVVADDPLVRAAVVGDVLAR